MNDLIALFLPTIVRIMIIVFGTLGVVFMFGRLLFPKMNDRQKNVIAAIAIPVISYGTILFFDYPYLVEVGFHGVTVLQYIWSSFLHTLGGVVFLYCYRLAFL